MIRWLVRLYPRAWRQRYEAEFVALLEQQPLTPNTVIDVVRGALDAHRGAWQRMETHTAEVRRGQGKEPTMKRRRDQPGCSFCGKSKEAVRRIVAGPGVYICDECVALCNELMANGEHMPPTSPTQRGKATRRREMPWWQRLLGRHHHLLAQANPGG